MQIHMSKYYTCKLYLTNNSTRFQIIMTTWQFWYINHEILYQIWQLSTFWKLHGKWRKKMKYIKTIIQRILKRCGRVLCKIRCSLYDCERYWEDRVGCYRALLRKSIKKLTSTSKAQMDFVLFECKTYKLCRFRLRNTNQTGECIFSREWLKIN